MRVTVEISLQQSATARSEEHTSELQSHSDLVCRLLLEKKKNNLFCGQNRHMTLDYAVLLRDCRRILNAKLLDGTTDGVGIPKLATFNPMAHAVPPTLP